MVSFFYCGKIEIPRQYNLLVKPFEHKVIYGIPAEHTHIFIRNNKKILVFEQLIWGGPQTAIIIEELACLKCKTVIGIGACGSITPEIPKGKIVINDTAVITDGTGRNYTKEKQIEINNYTKKN